MSTTQIPTAQASGLTTEHLVKALTSAAEPKPAKWIQDQLPKQLLPKPISQSGPVIEALLESAIEAGQVWRYGKTDKALYWHSAPQAWVQRCLLNKLAGGMKTKSDLIGTVCNLVTVKGVFPKTQVEPVLKELIAAGQILVHPAYAGGRTKLHSLRPADPADYLSQLLQQQSKKFKSYIQNLSKKLNVSPSELTALAATLDLEVSHPSKPSLVAPVLPGVDVPSPKAPSKAELILQAMHDINPQIATGDMVSLIELRKRLDFQFDKEGFDQAILDLAAQQKIAIHRDDFAGTKTDAEREALVRDEYGKFYNVVSLRRHS